LDFMVQRGFAYFLVGRSSGLARLQAFLFSICKFSLRCLGLQADLFTLSFSLGGLRLQDFLSTLNLLLGPTTGDTLQERTSGAPRPHEDIIGVEGGVEG